ncbi:MAG: hypothetical protein M1827_001560 [Pycnora praestabilis]|nr:MAG: hypothetical protein M1827_001560 [Pycnora praestabilis]
MSTENPLLTTLPPATDYLTYLTVIEYNLTPELLPTLHNVLQDATLTTNIGWDLIHLLLPLLPESEECLQDVARLGNPREVVLKVTESLRQIDFGHGEAGSDLDSDDIYPAQEHHNETSKARLNTAAGLSSVEALDDKPGPILTPPVIQFITLLSLLSILHPRIKTKYPSRFLSGTLQAILRTYSDAIYNPHFEKITSSVVRFVKTISGNKRPHLPPRQSSTQILKSTISETAPDPEAHAEPPSSGESAIQTRLLQSFATHILEDYLTSCHSVDDTPGLAWASRLEEKAHPDKIIPGKMTYAQRFAENELLQGREAMVGQMVALARDLGLSSHELYRAVEDVASEEYVATSTEDEDSPPSSVEAIPLSKVGSLFLFMARTASLRLYYSTTLEPQLPIFPDHTVIVRNFMGGASPGAISSFSTGALTDSILALGLIAINEERIGQAEDDEGFSQYLQTISLISANNPSPTLRYHAHVLTSSVLHSHPSDIVRLSFIRDTLEHCPYENLKSSAVGWLKEETMNAHDPSTSTRPESEPSIFATPVALDTLAPFLFPDLTHDLGVPTISESWMIFKLNSSFYLATLNLYYLLISAKHLCQSLDIPNLHNNNDIGGSYIHHLRQASNKFKESLGHYSGSGKNATLADEEGESGVQTGLLELKILDFTLDRVTHAAAQLSGA